ncbi:hypothetical protein [Vibrio campbellii]|uniref:hypothetical protein n=1 Tax=Vibrio campbellii TaxID=680 RepID=UPI0005EE6E65|nr:hypothetical protein [Vibrio campbellii]
MNNPTETTITLTKHDMNLLDALVEPMPCNADRSYAISCLLSMNEKRIRRDGADHGRVVRASRLENLARREANWLRKRAESGTYSVRGDS